MSSHQGWIRLDRAIFNWQWYTEQNVKSVFLHALLRANHSPTKWRGISIKRGQFFTSLDSLSHETGLSKQKIRTALKKLESTGELTSKPQAGGRMITVIKYNDYQDVNSQPNRQATGEQQATNRELTANNHDNQNNHENNTLSDDAPPAEDGEFELFEEEIETGPTIEEEAERVWKAYPAKAAKAKTMPHVVRAVKAHGADWLIDYIERYAAACHAIGRSMKNGDTFFRNDAYEDDIPIIPLTPAEIRQRNALNSRCF